MNKLYWNIDPYELIKKNPNYNFIAEIDEEKLPTAVTSLILLYRNKASECVELIKKINYRNFEENIVKLLEKEAYLSEIGYYLEKITFDEVEREGIHTRIEKEYLVDYYFKLSQAHDDGYFLVSQLKQPVFQQRLVRFGEKGISRRSI